MSIYLRAVSGRGNKIVAKGRIDESHFGFEVKSLLCCIEMSMLLRLIVPKEC